MNLAPIEKVNIEISNHEKILEAQKLVDAELEDFRVSMQQIYVPEYKDDHETKSKHFSVEKGEKIYDKGRKTVDYLEDKVSKMAHTTKDLAEETVQRAKNLGENVIEGVAHKLEPVKDLLHKKVEKMEDEAKGFVGSIFREAENTYQGIKDAAKHPRDKNERVK